MTRWTFEEVRALGERGDKLERALVKIVEEMIMAHDNVGKGERAMVEGSEAFVDAVRLLKTMKLETTREALVRMGVT